MFNNKIKKIIASVFLSLPFVLIGSPSFVEARVNLNDPVVAPTQLQDNVLSRLILTNNSVATSTLLVDVSDTINFKHGKTSGVLEISQFKINWVADSLASTTVKFGVISSTTPSGNLQDIIWFEEVSFSSLSPSNAFNGRQSVTLDYQPSALKLDLTGTSTNNILSGDTSSLTTQFATTTKITSPVGDGRLGSGSFPAVGDLIMRIYDQRGAASTTVSTLYRIKG